MKSETWTGTPAMDNSRDTLMPSFGATKLLRGDFVDFRPSCTRCLRAASVCYCAEISAFRPTTEIILLQHPRERRNPIGTARLTHLCLENSRLICDVSFERNAEVNALLDSPDRHCVVLFPGADATNLSLAKEELFERAALRRLCVFVIDGTWSQAKSMLRLSPRLAALPKVSFSLEGKSRYRIRKQPKSFCLSTVESVHRMIRLLEPNVKADGLLRIFDRMVETQLACVGKRKKNFS